MRNLLVFLTFLIQLNLFSQTSSEINLGYNFQLQKNKQEQLYVKILDQKVNCLNAGFAYNFSENELFNPKLFFNINCNKYDLKYTENVQLSDTTSQISNNRFRENDLNFQLGFIAKLNVDNPQKIKIKPQFGVIFNYLKLKNTVFETDNTNFPSKEMYSSASREFSLKEVSFKMKLLAGLQFEKKINENYSLVLDCNYLINLDNYSVKYYNNRRELQLNLGLKSNITKMDSMKLNNEIFIGAFYGKTFYTFSADQQQLYAKDYSVSELYPFLSIKSNGMELNFKFDLKKITFRQEFSYSKIDINLEGSRTLFSSSDFANPYYIHSIDKTNYYYQSTKNELRFGSSIGFRLFRNSKFQITPFLGINYVNNSKSTILKDEYKRSKYSEYYSPNELIPVNVVSESMTTGKASDYLDDHQIIGINPKISLLFTFQITPKIFLSFNIDRIFNAESQVSFLRYIDNHKYQFNSGLYYSIYKNKGIKKETLKRKL